ncbi:Hpt domain-containing protein [Pseudidiomarina planktonica]|uniref:Hpt domain-containing protein n=1 Tax=Pseudidiomarina planktonica TaxID=1323738 RepID=UPI0013009424|nr:Hpt domain-containing protein [Pseudidiomarina planktonica]
MTRNRYNANEVDVQLGLRYCHGRSSIYRQILEHYVDQYGEAPTLASFQQQSPEDIVRWLHTLKGHSATIGATAFSLRARELQQDWHNLDERELNSRWQELSLHMQRIVAEAREYIQLYQAHP